LEGGSYTGNFALKGEPRGRAPLLGTSKDMPSKDLEIGICFHRSPVLGKMRGSFPRAFERRLKFLLNRSFIEEFNRHVTEGSGKGPLSKEAPVGKIEGNGSLELLIDGQRRALEMDNL
jgi:hypothetical protein